MSLKKKFLGIYMPNMEFFFYGSRNSVNKQTGTEVLHNHLTLVCLFSLSSASSTYRKKGKRKNHSILMPTGHNINPVQVSATSSDQSIYKCPTESGNAKILSPSTFQIYLGIRPITYICCLVYPSRYC